MRRPKSVVFLVLVILGFLIYGLSINYGFVLDDEAQIVNNQVIHSLSHLLEAFSGSTMDSLGAKRMAGIYYKPIMTVSYILLWFISEQAWVFHLYQLFLHIGNAFLIFLLFNEIGKWSKKPATATPLFSLILAISFLVHPVNVETVVYIADLQDILYTFFGLLAMLYLTKVVPGRIDQGIYLGILFELSLLSKESGILFLMISAVYCWLFERNKLKLWMGSALGSFIVYLILRLGIAQLTHGSNSSQMLRADLIDRIDSIPRILFHYLTVFLFPKDLTLVQDWVVRDLNLVDFWLPLLCLLAILVKGGALIKRTKDPVIYFFLTWLILGLGAHSNLVPLDGSVADRWFYFPMIGLLGLLGFYLKDHFSGFYSRVTTKSPRAAIAALLILFSLWSLRSFARTLDWESGLLLYQHDLELMPDNFYLVNNVGVEFFRVGKVAEALDYFKKSAELFPEWTTSWNNLGSAYRRLGRYEEAEKCFLNSVRNGATPSSYSNYLSILVEQGKKAQAHAFLNEAALRIFPENPYFKELKARAIQEGW